MKRSIWFSLLFSFTLGLLLSPTLPVKAQDATSLQIPVTDEGLPGSGPIRRYPWFQKLWVQKRTQWSKEIDKDQKSLVFLGDSITQGWGPRMGNSFPGVKVANRGISGDTTRGVLIRLQQDVLSLNPSGVVLLVGTNDLEEGADAEIIAGNLMLILQELKNHNAEMPVILCRVFPSSASKKRPVQQIQKINDLYATAVKGDAQITLINTWKLFADSNGNAKVSEFPDLLHPNKTGYDKWAAALRPILATHQFLETEPDEFQLEPGFKSLFNGRDLTGWGFREKKTLNKQIDFDRKTESNDGRYVAVNGRSKNPATLDYQGICQGFCPEAGIPSHSKCGQWGLHQETPTPVPRLSFGRTL